MKSNSLPRALVVGAFSLTVALGLSACSASNETDNSGGGGGGDTKLSGDLDGAGATSQEAAMAAWKAGFQGPNPDVTVNYDAVGSGGGREAFLSGGVLFAGSDSYLTDDEITTAKDTCGGDPIEVPVYVSPIAVIYNLPGVDDLQLSPSTVAQIFAGKVTSWDDPAITADNPDASLPSSKITPVHRSDESGTTANFTDYLSQAASSDWSYGSVETWPIKSGEAADGTSGVIAAVRGGDGTVGYADESQAGDLGKALIGVGGDFVAPTADAASAVLDESTPVSGRADTDQAIDVNRTTDASGVYPIVLVSYHITCTTYDSQEKVDLVKGFESYVISSAGQGAAADAAGSAPITDAIREKAQTAIDSISVK
ncbi:MAG: phosphate ABC transporter substrate-binding protein PstS [Nocardioidaceae bacterium]